MAPKIRLPFRKKKAGTSNLPMMTPPPAAKDDQDWYRRGSDVLELPGKYEEEEEDETLQRDDESTTRLDRQVWTNQVEFLMSCIATSVGLGNVWRFAFVAYQNGGGAFLIPYVIVLIFIGKPMYYLECIIGQFSSRNSVRIWSCAPAMKGTGYAQSVCILYVVSYYVAIVSLCLHYLVNSFRTPLPWSRCDPSWENCIPSDPHMSYETGENSTSSAELYFIKNVLKQKSGIEDGLGYPIWDLMLCLLSSWLIIFLIVAQGVKSSGKAAYFLALFPYFVMIILLISTMILPGSGKGVLFFITPQWEKLLELDVWYAAVTQVFFSLGVGMGPIIMFSSYNSFTSNVHRDSMIITTLDTMTSLLSGSTIFGILGNLAYELKCEIQDVVGSGGTGLAFISYPDAIAKTFMPQVFAVLFFVMMAVLGIGSAVALLSTINTVCLDAFAQVRAIYITMVNCTLGFISGIVYLTPGGQYILELVDYYGATFLALFCAICEIVGIIWIYGLEDLCLDLEYMLGEKTTLYWRLCWGFITPVMMISVFVYGLFNFQALVFGGYYVYPYLAYLAGYFLLFFGISFVPIFICIHFRKQKVGKFCERLHNAFKSKSTWGPRNRKDRKRWETFKDAAKQYQKTISKNKRQHLYNCLTGGYRKGLDPGQAEPSKISFVEMTPIKIGRRRSSTPKSMAETIDSFVEHQHTGTPHSPASPTPPRTSSAGSHARSASRASISHGIPATDSQVSRPAPGETSSHGTPPTGSQEPRSASEANPSTPLSGSQASRPTFSTSPPSGSQSNSSVPETPRPPGTPPPGSTEPQPPSQN